MAKILAAGTVAPGFKLRVTADQWLSLSDLKGRPVIIAFYPSDWIPLCADQMEISVDGVWSHQAFAKDRHLHFPLLSDFHPKGAVARSYGAYREDEGVCERALFVIDGNGVIFWSYLSPIGVTPGADGILEALEALSNQSKQDGQAEGSSHAA
jgi:peroxiredoxin